MKHWRWLILVVLAVLLAACAEQNSAATATYTILPSATRTALASATLTPTEIRQPSGLPRPSATAPLPPATAAARLTASPTVTLAPYTPRPYTPPTPNALALSPANAGQGQELAELGNGRPADVAWSPDGALLAVAAFNWVDLYNTTTWDLAAHYPLLAQNVAFSPAGGFLVAASGDTVRWLDLATGTVVREQRLPLFATIRDLVFSPAGRWLAVLGSQCSGCGDATFAVEVLDAATGAHLFDRTSHNDFPALAFSPDGRMLAFVYADHTVLLDADTGSDQMAFDGGGTAAASSSDGLSLLVMTNSGLQTLTLVTGEWAAAPSAPVADGFVLSADGQTLLFLLPAPDDADCGCEHLLTLWDFETGRAGPSVSAETDLTSIAFSPDSRQVAWADYDAGVLIVDRADPAVPRTLAYTSSVTALSFGPASPSGPPLLLAGDAQSRLWQWDLATGERALVNAPYDYNGPPLGVVTALDYSMPDGLLLTSYAAGLVRITDPVRGLALNSLDCPGVSAAPLHLSRAGGVFAARCDKNGPVLLYDLDTVARLTNSDSDAFDLLERQGQWLRLNFDATRLTLTPWPFALAGAAPLTLTLPADYGNDDRYFFAASADGRWLAGNTGSADIVVWDGTTGQIAATLTGHVPFYGEGYSRGISELVFSPTTGLLASIGVDGTVRLWDPAAGVEVRRFELGAVTDLAFSADGRYLAASSGSGVVRVWGLPADE